MVLLNYLSINTMKLLLIAVSVLTISIVCIPVNERLREIQVTNVVVVNVTSSSVELSWAPVDGAGRYTVILCDSLEMHIRDYSTKNPFIIIDSLQPATKYCLFIGASPNIDGPVSQPSEHVWVRTLP